MEVAKDRVKIDSSVEVEDKVYCCALLMNITKTNQK